MYYNIEAFLSNGMLVFTATTGWIPQIGSEIEIIGRVYTVKGVRYKVQTGTTTSTNVVLTLNAR